jgi:hypothetical protein
MAMTINLKHLKDDDGFRRAYDVMLELRRKRPVMAS